MHPRLRASRSSLPIPRLVYPLCLNLATIICPTCRRKTYCAALGTRRAPAGFRAAVYEALIFAKDLADDCYQIAEESRYNYSKKETGKEKSTHEGVLQWHYFVNEIYFAEKGSALYAPYTVSINVKEKADGTYVYSFSAEKEEGSAPQTLHAVVRGDNAPNEVSSNTSISNSGEKSSKNLIMSAAKV